MELKINTSISLSTGGSASASIIKLSQESFNLEEKTFYCELCAWSSQANKDAGKDHVYLFNSEKIINLTYTISDEDLATAASDGHYGIIGTNHPANIKTALADILSIEITDIEVTSLI